MTDEKPPKLVIRNLRKTFGEVIALADVSLDLIEGEFLTILGPSGSGKSTLLWAIAGLNNPDSGEIWIDGKEATYLPPFKRDIGMVFQNYALFPHMTIFENIAFPLQMRKKDSATVRLAVKNVLDLVRLPDIGHRYPFELSGGQQQRIALARAFVYNPSIILMDEPLGALDKKLRDFLQLEIKHLHQQLGITVLYVTHDQEEAMVMSDRICLMNGGQIEQIGTSEDLYFRPASVFAADFLGESNLIDAKVKEISDDSILLERPDGLIISAISTSILEIGEEVKFMMRPETVSILPDGDTRENVVQGIIKEAVITGSATKLFVGLPDGETVLSTQLTRGPVSNYEIGRKVKLGWDKDLTVALKMNHKETKFPQGG
ncbi:MAG: ABC transporter ATP-binding protein [Thermodesulfobacteriota bacterium]